MKITVDFYYGLGSRYSYLAASKISQLERENNCQFIWKPIYSGDLIQLRGQIPFTHKPVSGQYNHLYRHCDAKRWADYYNIPFHEPKISSLHPQYLALATLTAGKFNLLVEYSQAVFDAIFAKGIDIDEKFAIATATNLGIPQEDFTAILSSQDAIAQLESLTQEAFHRGAFGVPTFFVGEEMFWGNDRLVLLTHYLNKISANLYKTSRCNSGKTFDTLPNT
ncbi:DSBA oxidoreductase [Calothrix sp. NIES-4101]|nr:DSBA oxidoreductase [Calothrix sp. NIES-4101]